MINLQQLENFWSEWLKNWGEKLVDVYPSTFPPCIRNTLGYFELVQLTQWYRRLNHDGGFFRAGRMATAPGCSTKGKKNGFMLNPSDLTDTGSGGGDIWETKKRFGTLGSRSKKNWSRTSWVLGINSLTKKKSSIRWISKKCYLFGRDPKGPRVRGKKIIWRVCWNYYWKRKQLIPGNLGGWLNKGAKW